MSSSWLIDKVSWNWFCSSTVMLQNKNNSNLKSGYVWISNSQKEVGLHMVWILKWIWNSEAQLFEIQTNGFNNVKNYFKIRTKLPDFEWSGFKMVWTIAIATLWIANIRNLILKKNLNVQISDPNIHSRIQIQWGLEFRTLEIRTHSKSEPFFVLFSNGSDFEWSILIQSQL